mgnify:CR=1 FL=1|jgi:hypothetical protein
MEDYYRELREKERNFGLEDEEPKPTPKRSISNDNYTRQDILDYKREIAEEKAQLAFEAGY